MARHAASSHPGDAVWTPPDAADFFAEVDGTGRRMPPELFRTLRRHRRTRIRLAVEVALFAAAFVMMLFIPNLGQIMLVSVLGILALHDLLLFLHLHRQVREAWRDLALGPEE